MKWNSRTEAQKMSNCWEIKNGMYVIITWLPNNNGEKNAYIGMEGRVVNLKKDGSFELESKTSVLLVGKEYEFCRVYEYRIENGQTVLTAK